MLSNPIFLICAALLPAVVLCVYVFKKDRVDKEPIGLLLKLFGLGVLICFPAAYLEGILEEIAGGLLLPYSETSYFHVLTMAIRAFIVVALVEEGLKFVVLYFMTRKSKHFNSLFDGIIYSVFVSLGFAALENVLYVLQYGFGNAIVRAVMSVPGHMFFAVIMGYYYSFWHIYHKAETQERALKNSGIIKSALPVFSGKRYLSMSLIVSVLAHGLYDFGLFVGESWSIVLTLVFIVFLYIHCFRRIKNMSQKDAADFTYSTAMIYKKYPYLRDISNSAAADITETTEETNSQII